MKSIKRNQTAQTSINLSDAFQQIASRMPQYLETLKQLGLKDIATQKGKGRVSSLSSISKQFFKTHYDGYHPRMSRHLATTLKRYISTRPKHERKTSEFVGEVRRKLLCLHEYNVQIAKVKFKYPRTEQLDALLIQYVELECGLLYDSHKGEVNETLEDEVTRRILRLLKVILHDALHNSEVPLKTTVKACDKALLKLFASVRVDCMTENNLIAKVILKLLEKLNLLDEVNQLKGKNIPFHQDTILKDQLVCRVRQNLTTSDYESNFDDSDEDEVEVTSIVHDDMFNCSRKPLERPLFNDYISKRDEKIKFAHLNHEVHEKEFSSFPCLSKTNQVTRLHDGFPSKIKCIDNCDDIFASDSSTTNSKNVTCEADSQSLTVCSDVNDSVFPSDSSRNSFEQKTVKLVDFENTKTLSNNETKNPKYPKEDVLCSSTFEKQTNCISEPVSQFQELNLTADHQNEMQDSVSGNMEDVHKKTAHQFEETGSVYESSKESGMISVETNNSEEVQLNEPQSNGEIGDSHQSEMHVSNGNDFENFFESNSVQIQEVQTKENNWIPENSDVNDVIIGHENNLKEATTLLPDSLNNNKETYSEVQDDNNPEDNIREKTSANKAMDQSNSMSEVPIFDTTETEIRKIDETTTSIPVTIDLDSLPDTNGLRSTKTSVSESITNGLVTIEILDDDDDEEADYTCISFDERQSQLKNNMANTLIQTNKIKVEDSEENHSSNFPISHTEKESQNFMDSNKTSRSSNSTKQNILKEKSTNESVRDVEIVISDSEDDSVEIVSNKCDKNDDELRKYYQPKENAYASHLENVQNVENGDTTVNNSSMQDEDTQNIVPQDEVPHIEEESLNQDENINKISDAAVTITNEESTEVGTEDGATCEEVNVESETTNFIIEEPSEDNEQQREVTSIHEESADTRMGLNSQVAEEVTSDIQGSEITTAICDDTSHLIQEDSDEIQNLKDTCTINDQTREMIIEVSVEPQNNSKHIQHDDKVNTSTECIEFDEVAVTSPPKCDKNKEKLLNVQETDESVCEDKNVNLSSDMSATEEHIEECEGTSQLLVENESVVATETFEDINNEEGNKKVFSKLNEYEDQKTLEVTVETEISNQSEIETQINTNTEHENVNTCEQGKKVVDTESLSNVTDDNNKTVMELENDQQEASVSENVGEKQTEVVYESHIQLESERHSEQTLIENSEIRGEITAENASHNESVNELCTTENIINEQMVSDASEITSTPVTTSNFIDTSESTNLQQNDYSSQNFTDQNMRDNESDHSRETENTENPYEVIDYSRTTSYISNDSYNNVYSNRESGLYNAQKHNMEIYSMENMHQTVSAENEATTMQNLVHTKIVQDINIPQKVQPQEEVATTTINESFYYKSNISSTLNEVEYVEYDTEKKVNLELLANIAVNQETLEVKTDLPSSDLSQETPKRRKSKVRLDYKKKMLSRETLPRAVKQFPKKISKHKLDEEIENNRITRNRINKSKANLIALNEISKSPRVHGRMDSKYKPHDFISVENPTIPPPTNNVYAQKRLMETNTTSEDSNDSCESTLFIDLGDKTTEKSVKSVFEEETIDDMLEFVSTEDKAAVCISIPDNEDNCISDSDSFQILKQIEDFVDNSQQSSVSSLTKEPSEPLDLIASVKSNTEEPSSTTANTISQDVEDTSNNSSDKDLVIKEDTEGNLESKTIKTTNHSIEHILNKTSGINEINVIPVNYSKEANIESTINDKCDVTSTQIQAELSKEIISEFNRIEDVQKTPINLCNGTILQTTFENHIEKSNTDVQSGLLKRSFKEDTSATPIEEMKETAEGNEQLQPENLSMNKPKFSSPRPEENSEKIFKTKAAMKAYEDKLQPELHVDSEKTESAEVTSESSLESPLRVDTGDSSIDKNDLNTSPISTTSFSSEIEVSSELNQSTEMNCTSCEQNINVSTDSANTRDDSVYDTAANLTKELSVDTKQVKNVTENLPTPQETEVFAKCKDDDNTRTVLSTGSNQEKYKSDNANQDLEKSQEVPMSKPLSITESSVIIDKEVVITEVECFNSESSENREESILTTEENKTQVNKDEKTIDDPSKHESLNISPKSTHNTSEKAKSSKIPDEEKGRMLENTIKKMKEKIVESERAKKEKSENKSNIQKDESHSVRDKSSSDKKHHRTSSKSNHSDDVKDKTNEAQKKDNTHRKRHSRSPSKSRTSDKKQDVLNSDKEKSHHKDSPSRSSSKSKSTDKRSKHHSDGENERKRRSKSISVDEKEKNIETSDQENIDRKRRSRSSSKSKSSDSKTKQISTDRASSKHKSSESKDKHSNTDDGKDSHKKRRSSKSPSKSKSSDKNDKKVDADKNKVRDKSETSKSKSSSTKPEIKSKKDDADLQQVKDKDKRHEGHKSSKSKDSSKTEVQSSQEKQNETQRKDEHVKNDKSRRSHSKEKTKIENNSRAEKREKPVSSTKEKHKENNKKSKHSSEESKETEVCTKSKKGSDKKSNNLCKEDKENASYTKKDKHSEKKFNDHHGHGEQKQQKENTLTSAKKNTLDNFENASSDVDLSKHTSKQNHINKNEQNDLKSLQTDVPKKRKHELLEENDKDLNNDGLSKPKIPKSDIAVENDIEKSISMENDSQDMEKEESCAGLNDQKIPGLGNESSEISISVPLDTNEDKISTPKQDNKSEAENLPDEDIQNDIKVSSDPETIQENPMVVKENPSMQLSEPEAKAMEIDTTLQTIPTKEDKISNDITNNNEITHITSEQGNKLKLLEVSPPEEKEPKRIPEVSPSRIIAQDAILPEITSSEPVFVPNTYSTSVTIDMQVLTSTTDSTVKHVEPTAPPAMPNVSVTAISTSTITSKEIPIPITIQSTPSCSTSGIQEKPVLFTFNPDGEIDALGLEDISPTKLPIGTNPSLDLISPSTSMSEISNSMNLVQTLGTSTINFISDPEIDIQQTSKQNSFAPNFTRGTRVTEIRCFVEKESTADHNYTLGDPLLGGNNEDKNILTTGLSLSNSPEDFPLNESHLEELTTFNENNFMEENGTLDDLALLLPCKKEKPDFDNIIDEAIPKPEDIENSIKHLNIMLVDNSQSGQPKAISVDNTANHTTPSDCSYSLGTDYAVNQLLFLRGSEVTSQNNSFPTIPDIENINIMESNISSSHQGKETTEDSINMRSHDETANINAICNSYTNFIPPVINQKVVVEPVEHCIITSLDQLEKDYNNINETCDRAEKNQPNAVANSETNLVKTSTPNKPSKFATFLQTVKKMDAQKNEAPKVKDEMENYTVRRHNRTPVFPPKKKTVTQQQHTKSPPESKKNEILLFDTVVPVSTSQTTELNECRIRVKTDLMEPPEPKSQVVNSLSSLDYINEHDQNVASEVVLPFSKPSPSEKISIDSKEKIADIGFKTDGEIAKTSKHARFDKEGNDYIMENILNSHNDAKTRKSYTPEVKVGEKQQDNVIEVNKKRKTTVSDNSDTSDNERYSKRADKRQKKSEVEFEKIRTSTTDHAKQHNKKSLETVVTPANNDEIFDKLLAEGIVNKVFAQRMTEQQQKSQQKNENGPSNVSSDVPKNRGYSTAPDGYKKVLPSPPIPAQLHESSKHRENVRHPHPDMDKRRDQRKPGYHQGSAYNPPLDRRYVDKRHGALPIIENSPKRFIRNSTNPYSSKSDPCTSRGQQYKSRDRRSSTEHLNNLLPNKKEGADVKGDDDFAWIKKLAKSGVVDDRPDLFIPGTKREDSRQ